MNDELMYAVANKLRLKFVFCNMHCIIRIHQSCLFLLEVINITLSLPENRPDEKVKYEIHL